MKLIGYLAFFRTLSERVYTVVFAGIFLLAGLSAYFVKLDTYVVEQKILSKQKDVAAVQAMKDLYESKRQSMVRSATKSAGQGGISLASLEEIVTKSFVGGRLASLKPASGKEERDKQQMAVDVKITGAALAEVVAFTKAAEAKGFRFKKLLLTLPQTGGALLDVSATLAEGSVR